MRELCHPTACCLQIPGVYIEKYRYWPIPLQLSETTAFLHSFRTVRSCCIGKVWEDVRKEQEAIVTFSADGKEKLGPVGTTSRCGSAPEFAAFCPLLLFTLTFRKASRESPEGDIALCFGTGLYWTRTPQPAAHSIAHPARATSCQTMRSLSIHAQSHTSGGDPLCPTLCSQ